VQALSLLATRLGQALRLAVSPAAKDPQMVGLYAGLAGAMAFVTAVFWWRFWKYDGVDEDMDALDAAREEGGTVAELGAVEGAIIRDSEQEGKDEK